MIDYGKLAVAREYLRESFKGCEVWDHYEFDRHAQRFVVRCQGSSHLVTISEEFFSDNDAEEISSLLKSWELAEHLKGTGSSSRIIVTTTGIEQEQ